MSDEVILLGRLDDKGYYQCIASNSVGTTIVTALVQVEKRRE